MKAGWGTGPRRSASHASPARVEGRPLPPARLRRDGSRVLGRRRPHERLGLALGFPGAAPEAALVADAQGEPVGVEALEDELGHAAGNSRAVAERGECDRARGVELLDQEAAVLVVSLAADREPVAEAN